MVFVSAWEATHCKRAKALHTLLLAWGVKVGGDNAGYTLIISCNKAVIVPNEYHKIGAISGTCSLLLLNSTNAFSL